MKSFTILHDSDCNNSDLNIEAWKCEIKAARKYKKGEFDGYYPLCGTCYKNRNNVFEYGPCNHAYCIAAPGCPSGAPIELAYGEVIYFARHNLVIPPHGCEACREWVKNATQKSKTCKCCGKRYIIAKRLRIRIKKYIGDPDEHEPKYCPSCTFLSEEERREKAEMLRQHKEFRQKAHSKFKGKNPYFVKKPFDYPQWYGRGLFLGPTVTKVSR